MTDTVRLPLDVLVKIGLWLPEASSFFAFLDALGSLAARGPLDVFWQLGSIYPRHDDLWPTLVLTEEMFKHHGRLVASAIALASHVVVVDLACDIDWFHDHVGRHTTITWNAAFPSFSGVHDVSLHAWFDLWAGLPITTLVLRTELLLTSDITSLLCTALPRCRRVTTLEIQSAPSLSTIFEQGALPPMLVNLTIDVPAPCRFTAMSLAKAIQWLATAPVQRVEWTCSFSTGDVEPSIQNTFFAALFTSPSLDYMALSGWNLSHLDTSTLPMPSLAMRELRLDGVDLKSTDIVTLAHAVRHSPSLEHLCLRLDNHTDPSATYAVYGPACEQLLAACVHVKTLELAACYLWDPHWHRLAPHLQSTKLESIALPDNGIANQGAVWIGRAIQTHATLINVQLDHNEIGLASAVTLIHCLSHRRVRASIDLTWNRRLSDDDKHQLRALAIQHDVNLLV
ncbi:Aste57867_792 [Aphanomyces stellatus]|uniref:Aste57867_792 protein n=1 Tax=Aphanomyces stellatus TaxID=120398 RepID=A0A485K4I5_9STRA|nr:hypothetical protein As57867_000791 [Aphanomyces stellatus]VFT78016.1 Aste57867_792 [Aphanomyces stellatus]